MQPYDFISYIAEDIISSLYKDDYAYLFFEDHIRFDKLRYDSLHEQLVKFAVKSGNDPLSIGHIFVNHKYDENPDSYHNDNWHKVDRKYRSETAKEKNYNFYEHCWEPIDLSLDKSFWDGVTYHNKKYNIQPIVIHSEYNSAQIKKLKKLNFKTVHWFAHAYLCSEFYFKHYSKLKMVTNYTVRPIQCPWICANRLLRQHRTDFLEILDLSKGCYSFLNPDPNGLTYDGPVLARSFDDHTNSSAEICVTRLTPWNTSFLHVVNETVWQDKIHFTEKVFKPIVLHQPFVVLQAPGSLAYLRSYGFKTFGAWWDEGYDTIEDPAERMQAIADIVNSIGEKSLEELETMRIEMASVLEHNFRHFYENIPAICLDELRKGIANL